MEYIMYFLKLLTLLFSVGLFLVIFGTGLALFDRFSRRASKPTWNGRVMMSGHKLPPTLAKNAVLWSKCDDMGKTR